MIINCIIVDDEPLARTILEDCTKKTPQLNLLNTFDNAIKAWDFLKREKVDLVFSDIVMPDIDGISFLKNLKNPPLFIYVTGNPKHAVESFELDVIDYIIKPFDYGRFMKAVNKAEAFLNKKEKSIEDKDFLVVKDGYKNVILRFDDIFYIEGSREYVNIATIDKDYLIHKTMNTMESILPSEKFTRVQKSYIINLDYAREVTHNKIIMKGSIRDIPLGLQYRDNLYQRLGIS